MRTIVVSDPPPAELETLLERRRRWGADHNDEVWAGVLHMNPAPHGRHADVQQQVMELLGPLARVAGLQPLAETNLGDAGDFRVPDGALQLSGPSLYYATAALVLEVVSPGDETWEKREFYADHGVEELLVVDPQERAVHWLALSSGGEYRPATQSRLVELGPEELARRIDWPALED